jgi:hypothetical protein
MNMLALVETVWRKFLTAFRGFFHDTSRLLRASPIFGGTVVVSGIVLGFGPALWWQYFSKFIDAAYSSRGVGTMTSDLTHAALWMSILAALMLIAIGYIAQTKALSRTIALTITVWGVWVTHVLALLPITKAFLIFLGIISIGFSIIQDRIGRVALTVTVFLLAAVTIYDLLLMMTRRSFSVGSMMEYAGIVLMLALLVVTLNSRRLKALVCAS